MRRVIAALLALCLALPALALAEDAVLLPGFPWEMLAAQPLDLTAAVTLTERMPLDEVRLGDLNALLRHMRLRLQREELAGEMWTGLSAQMDGQPLLSLTMVSDGRQTRVLTDPGGDAFVAEGDTAQLLFGAEVPTWGLDTSPLWWLADADALVDALQNAWPERLKDVSSKTNVKGFGTSARKKTWTVKKADVEGLAEELAALAPEGPLRSFLAALTFTGSQKLTCLTSSDGAVLRLSWEGDIGIGEDTREVILNWNRKRTPEQVKDALTLKTPAARGRNRDTLTLTRELSVKGDVHTLSLEAGDDFRRGEARVIWTYKADLTYEDGLISGTLSASEERVDTDEGSDGLTLTPNGALTWSDEGVAFSGSLGWEAQRNGHATFAGVLDITSGSGASASWEMPALTIPLSSLSEAETAAIVGRITDLAAARLVKQAVLLPPEDALYFSRGLRGWEQIVEAGGGDIMSFELVEE